MGQMVEFQGNGKTWKGYLSEPTQPGPGLVLLQEWWGLVGHIRDVADRFAASGLLVLAPDLYEGKTTDEPDEAGSLMMALNIAETEKALRGASQFLLDHKLTVGESVGVIGFCMGGQLSLYAATINPQIGACIDFYGIHPNVTPDLNNLHCPLLGFFAEHDPYASPEVVAALSTELDAHGKDHEFRTFPGTQHAFFNSDRPEVYDSAAAEEAFERSISFLREHL